MGTHLPIEMVRSCIEARYDLRIRWLKTHVEEAVELHVVNRRRPRQRNRFADEAAESPVDICLHQVREAGLVRFWRLRPIAVFPGRDHPSATS